MMGTWKDDGCMGGVTETSTTAVDCVKSREGKVSFGCGS